MRPIDEREAESLLDDWRWLVPRDLTPLFVTMLGDWIFGAADGSLWALDMLEGNLRQVASSAAEYNRLNKSREWLEETLLIDWYEVALEAGLVGAPDDCIGWARHPMVGGRIERANLRRFSMRIYQSLMGQLHRQLRG
jgi:hypothetical protein